MSRLKIGVILIIMLFGHNFVLNQTQSMQQAIEKIHQINVTEFNLLYSIPSAVTLLFIIPIGFIYERCSNCLLLTGAFLLSLGQLFITIFGSENRQHYYRLLMSGRVMEALGAEILYMIQGNIASSFMGRFAGIVLILPECGEIANVLITPELYTRLGIRFAFFVGFLTCLASSIACVMLYLQFIHHRKKNQKTQIVVLEEKLEGELPSASGLPTGTKSDLVQDPGKKEEDLQDETSKSDSGLTDENIAKPNTASSIFSAGRTFWLMILLCAVNQCLFFPFMDNANELITTRFCIPYELTGFYLAIPFLAAMITSFLGDYVLSRVARPNLIFYVSALPLLGHAIIFLDENCSEEPTVFGQFTLVVGLCFFGIGIGAYYTVSFPGVGLSVPQSIRGTAYACMGFFQTISITLIPILSGLIIESDTAITNLSQGYKDSSLLFVLISIVGVVVSYIIYVSSDATAFIYDDEEFCQDNEKEMVMMTI